MKRWLKRFGGSSQSLTGIQDKFLMMLADGLHAFELATDALLGTRAPETVSEDLFSTDRRINRTEQEIRREIVVHGSVYGETTFPELLVMMSLVKDAERVGDYAKNLHDLAAAQVGLGDELDRLREMKDRLREMIARARSTYESRSTASARELLGKALRFEDECDAAVAELLRANDRNTAPAVLAFRYFKRIASHVSNVATSLVVPLDKLDFFDEPKSG